MLFIRKYSSMVEEKWMVSSQFTLLEFVKGLTQFLNNEWYFDIAISISALVSHHEDDLWIINENTWISSRHSTLRCFSQSTPTFVQMLPKCGIEHLVCLCFRDVHPVEVSSIFTRLLAFKIAIVLWFRTPLLKSNRIYFQCQFWSSV